MGVEYLQQFDVGGNDRNQITLVPAIQLGRAESSQRPEHLVPQKRQQFEGDESGYTPVPHTAETPARRQRPPHRRTER